MAGRARNPILGAARARRARQVAHAVPAKSGSTAPELTAPEQSAGTAAARSTPARGRRQAPAGASATSHGGVTRTPSGLGRSWRQWPPHVRQGTIGAVLLVIGGLGYSGLLARVDPASPLAPIGQLLYALFGWAAFPLMTLLVVDGGLRTAEGMARRTLLRPYLFAVALALWLVAVAASQLFFGGATGGMLGAALAAPLRGVPALAARVGAVALGAALLLVLAGVGVREVGRGVVWVVRGGFRRVPWATWAARPAGAALAAAPKRSRRLAPPPAPRAPVMPEEVPARLLLPTAGFPQLEAGLVAWELPPLDLFDAPAPSAPSAGASVEEVARRLERALATLGLEAEVRREEISVGPGVIRLGLRPVERAGRVGQPPSARTPVSHLLRARPELAAALGVRQLRLEAP
ncbi:MAG TPA: DNA translocase FtsK, partial [Ktedonobacterales bacterium]